MIVVDSWMVWLFMSYTLRHELRRDLTDLIERADRLLDHHVIPR